MIHQIEYHFVEFVLFFIQPLINILFSTFQSCTPNKKTITRIHILAFWHEQFVFVYLISFFIEWKLDIVQTHVELGIHKMSRSLCGLGSDCVRFKFIIRMLRRGKQRGKTWFCILNSWVSTWIGIFDDNSNYCSAESTSVTKLGKNKEHYRWMACSKVNKVSQKKMFQWLGSGNFLGKSRFSNALFFKLGMKTNSNEQKEVTRIKGLYPELQSWMKKCSRLRRRNFF